jgi:hypothetical protein
VRGALLDERDDEAARGRCPTSAISPVSSWLMMNGGGHGCDPQRKRSTSRPQMPAALTFPTTWPSPGAARPPP